MQVKSVLDALRDTKDHFNFLGEDVALVNTVGIFITMNPGVFVIQLSLLIQQIIADAHNYLKILRLCSDLSLW